MVCSVFEGMEIIGSFHQGIDEICDTTQCDKGNSDDVKEFNRALA